jgi:hypothetical protein
VLYEWGDKCVNPEYEKLRSLVEPRATPPKAAVRRPAKS